jgi:DHA2 family multidrug resistance protein
LLMPIIITGFALSFVFVPITTQAYGTLPNQQIGNASGIFNLVRNIGGSVGISVAQTLLTRRSDAHQNEIINYVPQSGYWFEQHSATLRNYFSHLTNAPNAAGAAMAQMYNQLGQQALLWAFVDVFRWMALLCFGCVGLVWLFKKVQPGRKPPAGAH